MKKWITVFLVAMACSAGSASAGTATLHATLVLANNDPAALDKRLDKISFQLRRMFRFEYYHFFGEGEAAVNLPGTAVIDLGHDNVLNIQASGGDKIRAEVNWTRGGQSMLNTTVSLKRGAHVVLGGPPHEGGTLIVTLEAR
jgi:hypothetical protein